MSEVRHRERPRDFDRPVGHRVTMRASADDVPQVKTLRDYTNKQQVDDPFKGAYSVTGASWKTIQEPPYSFYALMRMPTDNSVLNQCIDAMVTNVDGHGFRLEYIGEEGGEDSQPAQAEKKTLEDLLNFPNDDYTLQELRDRVRRDYETIGNAYIEIGRDKKGRVVMLSHLPAHTVRMTNKETDYVEVDVKLPRDGKTTLQKVRKRFRRFVQLIGNRKVYFKEYGDPRAIDPQTGDEAVNLGVQDTATEIIHLCTYNPASPYGMPRWFNQIRTILGTAQAEMINLDFFRDNAIPAMVLMVSGGAVTQSSLDQIGDHFNSIRGRAAMNRILVVEATGDSAAADNDGKIPPPKMEMKPLVNERQTDATFQDYDKNGMDKIRSAFRLPPLFIGRSEDMTYATAKTSYEVAEGQVFAPDRQKLDDMINLKILSTYDTQYWSFRSNPPRLSDSDDTIKALTAFDAMGALTPNIAIGVAKELFDLEIEQIDEDWGDYPFEIVTAMVAAGKLKMDLQNVDDPPSGVIDPITGKVTHPNPVIPGAGAPPAAGGGKAPRRGKPATDSGTADNPINPKAGAKPKSKPGQSKEKPAGQSTKVSEVVTRSMLDLAETLRSVRDEEE
jgi:PBSX family phage portal protein